VKIRKCCCGDFETIYSIIHEAAQAYRGVIPEDCWKEPYMSREELHHEIDHGVAFWGYEEGGQLAGVMGLQPVQEVALIRHAYVLPLRQRRGIGERLLFHLQKSTTLPILVGTWADAPWAIRFYEKNGFLLVSPGEKDRLLRKYWSISARQIETSVVLANQRWFAQQPFTFPSGNGAPKGILEKR